MASRPLNIPYTPAELQCSRHIAVALWVLSATLLALLAAWSIKPMWTA